MPWFEEWFKREYFPKLAKKFQHELDERSKNRSSILDRFTDRVTSWIVGTTKGMQAAFVFELLDKNVKYTDAVCFRFATVNLGGRSKPNPVIFIGVADTWMLAPWYSLDFDNASILEEIERSQYSSASRQ